MPLSEPTTKAVILARGLGTRMRSVATSAGLTTEQAAAADAGVKGMIPIGRPFLDYLVSALADAGITDVCLVIGPEHERVRTYYQHEVELTRVRVHFAVQDQPLGTADAVAAVESFADGDVNGTRAAVTSSGHHATTICGSTGHFRHTLAAMALR